MASSTLVTLMLLTLLATSALAQALGSAPASLLTKSSSPTSSPSSHASAPTSKPPTPSLAPTPSATPPSLSSAPSTSPPAPPPPIAPTPSNAPTGTPFQHTPLSGPSLSRSLPLPPPPHAGLPTVPLVWMVMASHGHGGHHYDNTNNFGPRRRLQPPTCASLCAWRCPLVVQPQDQQLCNSVCQKCCQLCRCVRYPPDSDVCPCYVTLRRYRCP